MARKTKNEIMQTVAETSTVNETEVEEISGASHQYKVTLTGASPLIFHKDNITWAEGIKKWRDDPDNKSLSVKGDDRSPAWTWIGCMYSDGRHVGIDADNLMTMLREAGAKLPTGLTSGDKTFKKATQYGIQVDQIQFDFYVPKKNEDGELVWTQLETKNFNELVGNIDFSAHEDFATENSFELFVKRAKVGMSKHVRVRPLFRHWMAVGSVTVIDEQQSGLTEPVLKRIFDIAGARCGLGDWRPSSKTPGSYGRFTAEIEKLD